MTAETSNARGDGRPGIDRLWDSQWVNIVNSPEVLEALRNYEYEDAVNIAIRMTEQKMAENFAAAPPPAAAIPGDKALISQDKPPAAARGDVRGLVAKWQECSCGFSDPMGGYESCPECGAALAAEGVQAGEVEQRARELLAQAWEVEGNPESAKMLRAGWTLADEDAAAIRALVAALSQQPEARGVVDVNDGHAESCACLHPGDRECNCHKAYGFATAYDMEVADCKHDYRETADDRLPSSWIDVCAKCGYEKGSLTGADRHG